MSENLKGYRLHNNEKAGILIERDDTGAQEIGRRAVRSVIRLALGKEPLPPENPDDRFGITFQHDDGSYDTGTRAIRNGIRHIRGKKPKLYKRTFRPIE